MSKQKKPHSYGDPSGPMIAALSTSVRASSTRKKMLPFHKLSKLTRKLANSFTIVIARFALLTLEVELRISRFSACA